MKQNIVLLLLVILLSVIPLLINLPMGEDPTFSGSDGKTEKAISEIQPTFKAWAFPLWVPPSSEMESLLFALQAAIGAGALGYCLGNFHGRYKREQKS